MKNNKRKKLNFEGQVFGLLKMLQNILNKSKQRILSQPFLWAAFLCLSYLLLFQSKFLFSGDIWAETHAEYLDEAINEKYDNIFQPGWAGYLSLIPSILTKFYIFFGLPVGYIDFYYKAAIVIFAILCAAFCASRFNQKLIKNYFICFVLALSLILILKDKSVFTFINVWYLGFVPLILICLNHTKLNRWQQIAYVVFGSLAALTKPSAFMLPFIIYRAVKTKEYFSNLLIGLAVIYQTATMLFFDPRGSGQDATHNLLTIAGAIFTGGATEFLKLFGIVPPHFIYIILTNIVLALFGLLIYIKYGLIRVGLLAFIYSFSVYLYVLAPDATIYKNITDFNSIYHFNFKLQRELLINASFLIIIFLALSAALSLFKENLLEKRRRLNLAGGILVLFVFMSLHSPIDTESAGVAANIAPFRHSINTGQSACVPLPPTTAYFPHAVWLYESNTTLCHGRNFDLTPNFANMEIPLNNASFTVPNDTPYELKTLYLVIKNESPQNPTSFLITENSTNMKFTGIVPHREKETINFIPINVGGLPFSKSYNFTITSSPDSLKWGKFEGTDKNLYYAFFADTKVPYFRSK